MTADALDLLPGAALATTLAEKYDQPPERIQFVEGLAQVNGHAIPLGDVVATLQAEGLEREALAVGKIDHPNCVATYDVGRLPDGSLYLAMELREGKSLADVLEQEGQLAPGRAPMTKRERPRRASSSFRRRA